MEFCNVWLLLQAVVPGCNNRRNAWLWQKIDNNYYSNIVHKKFNIYWLIDISIKPMDSLNLVNFFHRLIQFGFKLGIWRRK